MNQITIKDVRATSDYDLLKTSDTVLKELDRRFRLQQKNQPFSAPYLHVMLPSIRKEIRDCAAEMLKAAVEVKYK